MMTSWRIKRLKRKRARWQDDIDMVRRLQADPGFPGLGEYGLRRYVRAQAEVARLTHRIAAVGQTHDD